MQGACWLSTNLPVSSTELILILIRIIFRSHAKVTVLHKTTCLAHTTNDPYAEIAADKKLDARHVIEEAMSELILLLTPLRDLDPSPQIAAALTRQCPKCNQSFIKTEGVSPSAGQLIIS